MCCSRCRLIHISDMFIFTKCRRSCLVMSHDRLSRSKIDYRVKRFKLKTDTLSS